VARLADSLLDSCPRLRILATSRETLRVGGEVKWPVPPLSAPDLQRAPTLEELESSESVRLFVERARGRDPAFSLSPHNALAVADICGRLEGMSLAIELAAARVDTLSVDRISLMLEEPLRLLGRGGRTTVPRQRTLQGALDWSYDLLSEPERTLFARLTEDSYVLKRVRDRLPSSEAFLRVAARSAHKPSALKTGAPFLLLACDQRASCHVPRLVPRSAKRGRGSWRPRPFFLPLFRTARSTPVLYRRGRQHPARDERPSGGSGP
jgi:hypothetical protein